MNGNEIAAEARKWIGTRWKHQGRDESGVDCAGLIVLVGKAKGLTEFDMTDYQREATDETMLDLCRQHLVPVVEAIPGDIAVIKYDGARHLGFFGDYLYDGLSLIHAYSRQPRRVIEHRFDDGWLRSEKASLIGMFRFHGVDA